jgi:hypothetical protein
MSKEGWDERTSFSLEGINGSPMVNGCTVDNATSIDIHIDGGSVPTITIKLLQPRQSLTYTHDDVHLVCHECGAGLEVPNPLANFEAESIQGVSDPLPGFEIKKEKEDD